MTINWWTLGLQAVNVLILVWLLSRFFWRPVAQAIATRQDAAKILLNDAKTTRTRAAAALAEITTTRAGLAAEREALLVDATTKAEAATKAALAEASRKAEALLKAAQLASERESDVVRSRHATDSALLAVDIARKLLARLNTGALQAPFLDLLVEAIDQLSPNDKRTLIGTADGIDMVSALELDNVSRARVAEAVSKALGREPRLNFLTDPELIAGFEMRTAHFVLRDSWQSDLEGILKDLKNAA